MSQPNSLEGIKVESIFHPSDFSEAAAKAMQARLQGRFTMADFFPLAADLPENLTVEQFRQEYGGVGSQRYRQMVGEIEARLDRCGALSPLPTGP